MSTRPRPAERMSVHVPRIAAVAGLAYLIVASILVTRPPYEDPLSTINYVTDTGFLVALLASAGGYLLLGDPLGVRRWLRLAACGQLVVATGVLAGICIGHEPSWFALVGIPGNLLTLAGTVMAARVLWRQDRLPRALLVLLALTVPVGIGLGGIGGPVVPAAFWLGLAWRRTRERAPALVR